MAVAELTSPTTIDELIVVIQSEFPNSAIRITGRARTIRRQAELMAQRIRANRAEFLSTYAQRPHVIEMDRWVVANAGATLIQTADEFEAIIRRARERGEVVSNHLSDTARDIGWPSGDASELNRIERRIVELGGSVIREPNAAGGRHWHLDW